MWKFFVESHHFHQCKGKKSCQEAETRWAELKTWRIKMESDTEWEDQLKAYFADHNGQTVIKSTLQKYFETNRSQNKTQQQEQSKILSVEFNAADVLATCTALYGRLIGDSYSTLIRCHELLNCSKEPFSTQFSPLPVLRYV